MPYYLADLISHWLVDLSLVRHRLPYRYDQNPIWCLYFAQGSYTPTSKIFPFYSQIIRLCQRCFQFWSGQSFITGRPHVHRFSHHSSFWLFSGYSPNQILSLNPNQDLFAQSVDYPSKQVPHKLGAEMLVLPILGGIRMLVLPQP